MNGGIVELAVKKVVRREDKALLAGIWLLVVFQNGQLIRIRKVDFLNRSPRLVARCPWNDFPSARREPYIIFFDGCCQFDTTEDDIIQRIAILDQKTLKRLMGMRDGKVNY
jgi:hypothetical protein